MGVPYFASLKVATLNSTYAHANITKKLPLHQKLELKANITENETLTELLLC